MRTSTTRRTLAAAAAGLLLVAGLAGCSKEIDNGDVEKQLVTQLKKAAPEFEYGKAECHDDLKAKVGDKADCDVQVGKPGESKVKQKVDAHVTKVDGDKVTYEFRKDGW